MDIEKLNYLLQFVDGYLSNLIYNLFSDSQEDPHYSAVVVSNIIKCYIQVEKDIGNNLPFANVKEFFIFNGYTEDEYDQFEAIRKKESKYYQGTQY